MSGYFLKSALFFTSYFNSWLRITKQAIRKVLVGIKRENGEETYTACAERVEPQPFFSLVKVAL